jgi:isopenicillin N synthase-like dioxygenase
MTNNIFKSTIHRVVISQSDQDRYSIAFFYEPNRQAEVKVLEKFITNDNPCHYVPIKYGQYLQSKYDSTHTDFKSNSI